MNKLSIIALIILFGLSACKQKQEEESKFKEETIFKNSDVEIRQLDEHTWHYWGDNLETPQRIKDVKKICNGILDGSIKGEIGTSLPYVVEMYGVKINYIKH